MVASLSTPGTKTRCLGINSGIHRANSNKVALQDRTEQQSFRSMVLDAVELITQRSASTGISGITFGIRALDSEIFGLQPSDRCVIAGETSSGKTALAFQAVLESCKAGGASAIFSLEMSYVRLVRGCLRISAQFRWDRLNAGGWWKPKFRDSIARRKYLQTTRFSSKTSIASTLRKS